MKAKDGLVARIKAPIKNKIGDKLEDTGTIVNTYGNECWVLLPDGNIWVGSANDLAPVKYEGQPVEVAEDYTEIDEMQMETSERSFEESEE